MTGAYFNSSLSAAGWPFKPCQPAIKQTAVKNRDLLKMTIIYNGIIITPSGKYIKYILNLFIVLLKQSDASSEAG